MRAPATPSSLRVVILGGRHIAVVEQIVRALPERAGIAVVVACPTELDLASLLRPISMLPITAVRGRTPLERDRVFVIPTEADVHLDRGELVVDLASPSRWSLDRLFRSLADALGRDAVAVATGGPGTDGALGIKRVKEAGGLTVAVTPEEGPEGEQARAAIDTGYVDLVLPGAEIAGRLIDQGQEHGSALAALEEDDREEAGIVADTLRDILTMLRVRSGHDFNAYKRATLYRRVARRMQVCQADSIVAYHQYLREHPGELTSLLRDFLISVTSFFRDPEAFEALERTVIPKLFVGKQPGDQVRVWVVGCATGEEAYSIGILLAEHAGRMPEPPQLLVFATDIDEHALAEARAGFYPESISVDVPEARLARFFSREAGGYRVSKELREMMLFSPHNILRDPPFSRLDLISCRNLLIYLSRDAQDRVLNVFHFGLRPDGFLMLGSSESAENVALQFGALDVKHRIYTRRLAPTTLGVDALVGATRWPPAAPLPLPSASSERAASFGELHHRLVERYAPPSVIVNEDLDVIHISEHAGRFLQIGGGEPTRHLLRMVHPALRMDLRTAIYAARQEAGGDARVVRFEDGGAARAIELRVQALELPELGRHAMLVMFRELDGSDEVRPAPPRDPGIEPVVRELEDELQRTRDQLRSTIEQYETSLEELKASNEELHAINEELRSATEELETSKEELQSVNEELITLNHELKVKVDEVSHANNDLQNLMTSTDIGVVFLDRALNIKRFTPRAKDLFNLIASDVGRPLVHLTHRLSTEELPELANDVLQSLRTVEREVQSRDGHRYLARLLPYRAMDDRIEGVVMTFVDVTDLKEAVEARRRSEAALRASEERLRLALHAAPMVALSLDATQRARWGYAFGAEQEPSRLLEMFAPGHADRFVTIARHVISNRAGQRAELDLAVDGRPRTYDFRIEPSSDGVAAVGFDITPSKLAETSLLDADRRKDEFLATLSHELRNPLTPLTVALEIARRSESDPAQLAQARAIMERQVAQLTQLVDELLDLSRITQGKIQIERVPLDPAALVEAALEVTRPLLHEHAHQLHVRLPERPVRVLGDHRRLVQVLTNLLSNAIKYTPDRGRIDLELEAEPARGVLVVRVRDNGVGISDDVLPRVFDIFVQSRDSLGRSQGGLGIGLNLVRRIVELHGGTVRASSAGENRGSELVIELPTAPA